MPDIAELLKVWAPVVSILIAAIGTLIAASAILQNLERGRRELAVNLIYNWANHTDWATNRSITIAKELSEEEIKAINGKRSTSIEGKHYDGVVSILTAGFKEQDLPTRPSG